MRIHFINFLMIRWYIIVDVKTSLYPTTSIFLIAIQTPYARFHSVIEQWITFRKVDDVYSDCVCKSFWVADSEIKPLEIATSICVISHPYIEFLLLPLSNLINISTFEAAVKSYSFFICLPRCPFAIYIWIISELKYPLYSPWIIGKVILIPLSIYDFFITWPANFIIIQMMLFCFLCQFLFWWLSLTILWNNVWILNKRSLQWKLIIIINFQMILIINFLQIVNINIQCFLRCYWYFRLHI